MPYEDGTGPDGRGPRTGRGFGRCTGYATPDYAAPGPGWGRGFGRGFGRGRGFRQRAFWAQPMQPAPVELSKEQQITVLEEDQKAISEELNMIKNKLKELKE